MPQLFPAVVPDAALRRVGITGHCELTLDTEILVRRELTAVLGEHRTGPLVGVSCLARGADQLFARIVLELGGTLEAIIPARDYRDRKVQPDNAAEFDQLLAAALVARTLPFERSCREAYMAASDAMLSAVDSVVAVWDGEPAVVYAGTADVVAEAHHRRLPVTVIWPPGATPG